MVLSQTQPQDFALCAGDCQVEGEGERRVCVPKGKRKTSYTFLTNSFIVKSYQVHPGLACCQKVDDLEARVQKLECKIL